MGLKKHFNELKNKYLRRYAGARLPDLAPKWVRLAPNGTNLGNFQIRFSTFWRPAPKCTQSDLKNSRICPIWGQSDPISVPIWSTWSGWINS